uniref:Transcription initiation factor TFIID subunit 4 n=1 Tax=Cacopsylla melanoneura TaxID=428564 RepID=A0A8D8V8H3_9HEMI
MQPTTIIRPPNIQQLPSGSHPMRIITQQQQQAPIITQHQQVPIASTNNVTVRNVMPPQAVPSPVPNLAPQQRIVTPRGKAAQQQAGAAAGPHLVNNITPSPRLSSPRPPRTPLHKANNATTPSSVPASTPNKTTMANLAHRLTAPKQQTPSKPNTVVVTPASVSQPVTPAPTPTKGGRGSGGARSQQQQNSASGAAGASAAGVITSNSNSLAAPTSKPFTSKKSSAVSSAATTVFSSSSSTSFVGDDDINDVAAMGGVNLAEESQRILGSTEMIGTQIRSVKDEIFLHSQPLTAKISLIAAKYGLDETSSEVVSLISHAAQSRLCTLTEKLSICAEHRSDQQYKALPGYSLQSDARGQLKFLESLDRIEMRRREEQERELLLRAAKSRSKSEDPEQVKLKAKAKEMQRAEMEELRQKAADLTALQAIGPRKKPKLEPDLPSQTSNGLSSNNSSSSILSSRPQLPLKPRVKRITMKDCIFLLEREKEYCKSDLLYKAYLK